MKVFHVTTAHPRTCARIFLRECCTLAKNGHDVTFVVCDGIGPEQKNNVRIIDAGKLFQNRILRILCRPWIVLFLLLRSRPEVVHFHDPELLPISVLLTLLGFKVVYDVHEDVPRQVLTKEWIPRSLRHIVSIIFELFENWSVRHLRGVITATPHIFERFTKLHPKVTCINNFPLMTELASLNREPKQIKSVCYIGAVSKIRGVVPLVEAMGLLPLDIRLIVCGTFESASLMEEVSKLDGWKNVDFRGQVNRKIVHEVMAQSAAGIVTFLPAPNHMEAQPNKMFEYMAAGLPVIASDFPLWRQIIHSSSCGLLVDPENPKAIAAAILEILESHDASAMMSKSGISAVMRHFNWDAEAPKLVQFYGALK